MPPHTPESKPIFSAIKILNIFASNVSGKRKIYCILELTSNYKKKKKCLIKSITFETLGFTKLNFLSDVIKSIKKEAYVEKIYKYTEGKILNRDVN